ncbi:MULTISPECIES: 6,7-dimethyl-8-ribityllumazine synthase [unclassified Aureispira]|uniref:6,7-dimethyl-8-ribityllumazine synthase n=1 Tax=unclassified Aureispira TaxID=2649989 RepID=UPI000697BF9F|nr:MULTISPECIES: 6,7-dimethyl-8-ribityllumazine synthase [unclassified Aureispira]WMX13389.1 6,7-dimethyl-8-ribityllumazine synthase [Aureispira sp. CCB-E]
MSSADKNLSSYDESTLPSAEQLKFGIVVADWNEKITHALYEGCYDTLIKHGAKAENIHTIQVPGTFELPQGARILNKNRTVDATICIGCVIKGETSHNEYINMSVAQGLQNMAIATSKPFIFGVLTPNSMEQALDRAGGKYGNKGVEAAVTALRMAGLSSELEGEGNSIGFGK